MAELRRQFEKLQLDYSNLEKQIAAQPATLTADQALNRIVDALGKRENNGEGAAKVKVAEPKDFDGKRENAEHFITQCELYFNSVPRVSDGQKISVALSHIRGTGSHAKWSDTQSRRINELHEEAIVTWADFVQSFDKRFGHPDKRQRAQNSIFKVRQHGTADDYIKDFEEYQDDTGYDEVALCHYFKAGIAH